MAVDALELRPRNAVALFDAAVRICATSTGVWALTLPSGALLIATLFSLMESARKGEGLALPVALWTLAWALRAVSQGAACHYVEQQVLGTTAPSIRSSWVAALKRAPGLIIATTWIAVLNTVLWFFTLGIGHLFFGAHAVGYAATMRGKGSLLGLYGTCSQFLGPTRHVAPWVRVCGLSQIVLGMNLHFVVKQLLSLTNNLLGFDVSFAERFASFDNASWVATVCATTFALFEPLRAATASLLLIDGRVRQEGLDLIAQVEQLPRHKKPRGTSLAIAILLCLALPARAEPKQGTTALFDRAVHVTQACEVSVDLSPLQHKPLAEEQSALARLISRVERLAYEEDDCEGAEADLREGLKLYADLTDQGEPVDAASRAQHILDRPEFHSSSVKKKPVEALEKDDDEPGWFIKMLKEFFEWLFKQRKDDTHSPDPSPISDSRDMAGANVVMIATIVAVVGVLLFILVSSFKNKKPTETALSESGELMQEALTVDPMSALSKPAETWAGLADTLAAQGEYREAIRHLYLALLSRLHRDGVIDYDPTFSNWEYLFAFKGAATLKTGFKELTRRFDFAWYGNLGVDAAAWAMFRQVAEPFLAPPSAGAPARA